MISVYLRNIYYWLRKKNQNMMRFFYISIKRCINRNNQPELISNDCTAGFIYKELGLHYRSPFIWCHISENDFLLLLLNFEAYINGYIYKPSTSFYKFVVLQLQPNNCTLPSIQIDFPHSTNYEQCILSWKKRANRMIDKTNRFIFFDIWQYENFDINMFNLVLKKYNKRIKVFSHHDIPFLNKKSYQMIDCGKYYDGKIFTYYRFGKYYFDKVSFLHLINKKHTQ